MRFLKSKFFWLTIYAAGVTGLFLYILFPSPLVLQQVKAAADRAGFALKAGSLHPSVPFGIKLGDLTVHRSQAPADVFFQGELLDLQLNPVSIFRKHKTVFFQGKAYGGSFGGRAAFQAKDQMNLPASGRIEFKNIDLARYNPAGFPVFQGVTGLARGTAFYITDDAASSNPIGKLSLYLGRGSYPLPEPFLGLSRIEFDRGEIQLQLKNGVVTLEKLEIYGTQVNCLLNGDVLLAPRVGESRLNLKGVLEIVGNNKVKMNVTVGGTLAQPSFRYL